MPNTMPYTFGGVVTYQEVAAGVHIYTGDLVAWTLPDKYLIPASDTAGLYVIGVAMEEADNSAGADGDITCRCKESLILALTASGLARTDLRDTVYCLDAKTVTTKAGTTNKIGVGVLLEIDTTNNIAKIQL